MQVPSTACRLTRTGRSSSSGWSAESGAGPILRSQVSFLLARLANSGPVTLSPLHRMVDTNNPRDFYRVSRIMLVLCQTSNFGSGGQTAARESCENEEGQPEIRSLTEH
jgi:hypothetical protein